MTVFISGEGKSVTDRTSTIEHPEIHAAAFSDTEIVPRPMNCRDDKAVSSLPLVGETVAFTGTLASMTHRDAIRLVEQFGGRATQTVSGSITMLVIGEEGWPLEPDGGTSQKLQQTLQLVANGSDARILSESDWLQLLNLDEHREEIRRSHTPAMLSQLLDVPVRMIRRWARLGLIRPVRRVCRLPYFDYREVASARRLAMLLDQGVAADVLERSLTELSKTMAGTDRSIAQLNLLVQDDKILMRDERGVLNPRTGQRLLDFDLPDEFGVFDPGDERSHQMIRQTTTPDRKRNSFHSVCIRAS
jgi:DNA-binding transcriptional MerR regulator